MTTDEKVVLLDGICWRLAQWICEYQATTFEPGDHGARRRDGQPCDDCYDLARHLVNGKLADLMSTYAQAAYHAGREATDSVTAAAAALRAIGQPIADALRAEG